MGLAYMVGAGIFAVSGIAATHAGPALTVSFAAAAIACALSGLSYAEMAAMVPVAESAYTFSFITLGELIAFIIGWDLILEFGIAASVVAVSWSAYLSSTLQSLFGIQLPPAIASSPGEGGVIDLPAFILVLLIGALLIGGIRLTSRVTWVLVVIMVSVLVAVIALGSMHIEVTNWVPYFPFGITGVFTGAAIAFFSFVGFDMVATLAEETRRPRRDVPLGLFASLFIACFLYIGVSLVMTGVVKYTDLNTAAPVADAFESLGMPVMVGIISIAALLALTKSTIVLINGQARVVFAMARDGMLRKGLARTHARFNTPYRAIAVLTVIVSLIAGFTPIVDLVELLNIGALFAFVLVSAGVVVLRHTDPSRHRPFRVPFVPVTPIAAILLCFALMASLSWVTWVRFVVWMAVGLLIYFLYSRTAIHKQ